LAVRSLDATLTWEEQSRRTRGEGVPVGPRRMDTTTTALIGPEHAAYLPALLPSWAAESSGLSHREFDASLIMFDISGFTRLTERLSRQGRAGAEELSDVLDDVFGPLVEAAAQEGADLLKWGGDAVLLLLDGTEHERRAVRCVVRMQAVLAKVGHLDTSVGRVVLRASSGVHSGRVSLVLAGDPTMHRELVVLGPGASAACRLDSAAAGGQIVVSEDTARALDPATLGPAVGPGLLVTSASTVGRPWTGPFPAVPSTPGLIASLLPAQLRTHLLQHSHDPEHRSVGTAFVRFDGTDQLLAARGIEYVAEAVDELVRNIQDSAIRHGISFHESDVDVDGGKVMLVAGAPTSTGDDIDHLVAAVRLMVERAGVIPFRIGVALGRVFTGELGPPLRRTYSVKGNAVNLAARLASKAAPGEVLAPAALLEHTHRQFVTNDHRALALKGLARPVEAIAIGPPREGDARPIATTVLVGREQELDVLTTALDQLGDGSGRGGVIEVAGEPGIGKTRLVTEIVSAAEDFDVLTAAGDRSGASAPYAAARQLLAAALGITEVRDPAAAAARVRRHVAQVAPELESRLPLLDAVLDVGLGGRNSEVEALDEEFRSEALQRVVVELLTATLTKPTLVVVEDTHLIDPASADLLGRLAEEAPNRPWLLVTTRREAAGGWRAAGGSIIELGPLSEEASRRLADVVTPDHPLPPATADAVALRAGGHPLFLRELALAAARGEALDDPPESVEELVAVQFDSLPADDRALLRRAAVLGNEFPLRLLSRLLDGPNAPAGRTRELHRRLDRLDHFVVLAGKGRLEFRHPVLREVAYAGLSFRTRAILHAAAAEILEADASTRKSRPELLALHYFAGGRYDQAWRHARRAGERANERFSPAAAAEAYARAAEAARRSPSVSARDRAGDLEALGDALFLCGRSDDADKAYLEAYREAGRATDDLGRAGTGLILKRAKVAQRQGRYALALRRLTVGLAEVSGQDGPEMTAYRARLLARRAVVKVSQGRYASARDTAHDAVGAATASGDLPSLAQAHLVLHTVHMFAGTPDETGHGEQALKLFEQLGDVSGQAHALNNLAMRRLLEGDWTESLEMFGRASAMFHRVGDAANEANASYNQADLLNRQGRHRESLDQLEGVLRVARAVGDEELVGLVLREQGRSLSREADPLGLELLAAARDVLESLGEPHEVTETDIAVAEAHLVAGRAEEALLAATAAIESAQALGAATLLPAGFRVRAAALTELGDLAAATVALDEGLRLSSPPELAHERVFLGVIAARHADLREQQEEPRPPRQRSSPEMRVPDGSSAALWRDARQALDSLGVVRVPLPWPIRSESAAHG
jgi:class 3 adenylate cyclase/tetratricopeptide (TPR) repeat protein